MTLKTILLGAASALLLSAAAADAVPATVQTSLNVRSGPGTQYQVVGSIPAGATVDVQGCTGTWCQVAFSGGAGFANRSYLAMAEGGATVAVAPSYAYEDGPYYDDSYDDGYAYGPSVGVFVNPGHRFHHGRLDHGHAWNGAGNWSGSGGRNWSGRPRQINPATPGGVASRQGFAGPPASWQRPGTGIGAAARFGGGGMTGAPAGLRGGGGGGAAAAAPSGGGAHGGFAGSIARH